MFHQRIANGYQVEEPDAWLREGFPWEIERIEYAQTVNFGGQSESYRDASGTLRYRWRDTNDVLAIPFDVPVPGYRNGIVNTLRLWSAAATDAFDLEEFNAGSYADAVAAEERRREHYHGAVSQCRDRERPGTAPAPAVFPGIRKPAGHDPILGGTAWRRLLGVARRRIVSSSTTHIRRSPCPSSCACCSTYTACRMGHGVGHHEQHYGLHESHIAPGSARTVARLDVPATASAAPRHHLRDQCPFHHRSQPTLARRQ